MLKKMTLVVALLGFANVALATHFNVQNFYPAALSCGALPLKLVANGSAVQTITAKDGQVFLDFLSTPFAQLVGEGDCKAAQVTVALNAKKALVITNNGTDNICIGYAYWDMPGTTYWQVVKPSGDYSAFTIPPELYSGISNIGLTVGSGITAKNCNAASRGKSAAIITAPAKKNIMDMN